MSCYDGSIKSTFVKDRYVLGKKIGFGAFSKVYISYDCNNKCQKFAMKTESLSKSGIKLLEKEKNILQKLRTLNSPELPLNRLPIIIDHGVHNTEFSYIILPLLGMSLRTFIKTPNIRINLHQIGQICANLLKAIQQLHSFSFIHRDIKPDNFLFPSDFKIEDNLDFSDTIIYLSDFGLATPFRDLKSHKHIPFIVSNHSTMGTPSFKSLSAHRGLTQSRRDDLQSLLFSLFYLINKSSLNSHDNADINLFNIVNHEELWFNINLDELVHRQSMDQKIFKMKKSILRSILSKSDHMLHEIANIILNVKFDEEPLYSQLYDIFMNFSSN